MESATSTTTSTDQLSQNAIDNLLSIEEEIEISNQYFEPKSGKTYIIRLDPDKDKIVP
jgi:hypothetical protein